MTTRRAFVATLAVAACSAPPAITPPRPTSIKVPDSHTQPVAQSCIDVSQIREARVVDERTIDFYVRGREAMRNTLPRACEHLVAERRFTYATSLTKLCSDDAVTVISNQTAGGRTASCRLGSFVPYTPSTK